MGSANLRIPLLLSLLHFTTSIFAIPYNVTVDDTKDDLLTNMNVSYSPPSSWYSDQDCMECNPEYCELICPGQFDVKPMDLDQVLDSTWHGSAFGNLALLNATATFRGTAIYVYCILNAAGFDSNMIFYLDGEQVGTYTYNSIDSPDAPYHYSVPVFQLESLSNDNHTFTLANGQNSAGNGVPSLVLLDYFKYTTDIAEEPDPSPSPSATPSTSQGISVESRDIITAIAAVSGILLIAIALGVMLFFKGRLRFHGVEKITRSCDKSSSDEDCSLMNSTESVPPIASTEVVEHRLLSPNRRTSFSEHTKSHDEVPRMSATPANQPSAGEAVQLVIQTTTPDTPLAPASIFIPPSMDVRAGRAPVPPPGVPILDGPPPSPGLLRRMYAAPSAIGGRSNHYDGLARGVFEGRQVAMGVTGSNQTSDKLMRKESSERLRTPPPGYLARVGSIFTRGGLSR